MHSSRQRTRGFRRHAGAWVISLLLSSLSGFHLCFSQFENAGEPWRWTRFSIESGLPSNDIRDVNETSNGTVWAVTSNGLAWYDGFQWIAMDSTQGIPQKGIKKIEIDLQDSILALIGGHLYRGNERGVRRLPFEGIWQMVPFDSQSVLARIGDSLFLVKKGTIELFKPFTRLTLTVPVDIVRSRSGSIWLYRSQLLSVLSQRSWKAKIQGSESWGEMRGLVESADGSGILCVADRDGIWEWTATSAPKYSSALHGRFFSVADFDAEGDVVAVDMNGEVHARHNNIWSAVPAIQRQLPHISCLRFRKNGDLWLGTENGLYLFRRSFNRWAQFKHDPPNMKDWVNEIAISRTGIVWLGTAGGVLAFDGKELKTFCTQIGNQPITAVTGLAEDNDGALWISSGSHFTGTYRWDGVSWQYFRITAESLDIHVHKIKKDRQGHLWFLGMRNPGNLPQPGAYRYDGSFSRWGIPEGLPSGRVYDFAEGRDGSYWFATLKGLSRWKGGTWKHSTAQNGGFQNRVSSLAIDSSGTTWFGDEWGGLGFIDADDNVHFLTTSDGLINNRVKNIVCDSSNTLWIGTYSGLGIFKNGVFSGFDFSSGLPGPFIWPILPTREKIYLGIIGGGLVVLSCEESRLPPPIVKIDIPYIEEEQIHLRWKSFSAFGLQAQDAIPTRYRLDNGTWSDWAQEREVTYFKLPPGSHMFQVEAKNLFSNISPTQQRVITIPNPFYLRWSFLVPTIGLSIGILFLATGQLIRRRRHTVELRASEARFRRLTEATFEGIILHQEGAIIEVNKSLIRLLGYKPEELSGKSIITLVAPAFRERFSAMLQEEKDEPLETSFIRKDGVLLIAEIIAARISGSQGSVRVLTIWDITDRKRTEERLLQSQQQLRSLASQLSVTEERDRRQMATYLHDSIGHVLALCKIKLGAIKNSSDPPDLHEIHALVEEAIINTRSLTFELSPPAIRGMSLGNSLEWLTEHFQEQHAVLIYFEDDWRENTISPEVSSFLFHTVRELLINVMKHAGARSIDVSLRRSGNDLEIVVEDDGHGFDTALADAHSTTNGGGFGLFNIRERLAHYGGSLKIASTIGKGTSVSIRLPHDASGTA